MWTQLIRSPTASNVIILCTIQRRQYNPRKVIASWSAHSEDNCLVCSSSQCWWQATLCTWQASKRRSCIQYVHTMSTQLLLPPTFCQQAAPNAIFLFVHTSWTNRSSWIVVVWSVRVVLFVQVSRCVPADPADTSMTSTPYTLRLRSL